MQTAFSFKTFIKIVAFPLLALIVSDLLSIIVVNQYIGEVQKQHIQEQITQNTDDEIEVIINKSPEMINHNQIETAYLWGMLIAWVPWLILGRYFSIQSVLSHFVVFLTTLFTYDPIWFTPLIFITSYLIGVRRKIKRQ